MQINHSINDGVVTMRLLERFDFNTHREFREGYEACLKEPGIKALDIDLGAVDYLNSSALGMLLMVKEVAAPRNISLRLTQCIGAVRQILEIANFGKLFTLA